MPAPGNLATWINPERIGDVTGLSFSPDGRHVLSSDRTGFRAARVWRLDDATLEFAFPALFPHGVWSPAGNVVAVGMHAIPEPRRSGGLKLYDLDQRREVWSLPEAGGLAAFSADGTRFVSGDWKDRQGGGRLHLWSLPDRQWLRDYPTRPHCTALALSPDGEWIAAAHAGSKVVELRPAAGGAPRELPGHHGGIGVLAFAPDGRTLASAGADQLVHRWSVPAGEALPPLRGHTDLITGLAWFPDGRRLVTASRDGTVRLWPAAPPAAEAVRLFAYPNDRVLVSPDGRWWTASHQRHPRAVVWNVAQGPRRRDSEEDEADAFNAGFDPTDGALLRVAGGPAAGGVRLTWRRPDTLAVARSVALAGADEWFGHACAPAAGLLALGQTNGWVRVFNLRTGALHRTLAVPDPIRERPTLNHPVELVALSPDGQWLAAGRPGNSQIAVFSVPENRLRHRLQVRPLFTVVDGFLDSGSLLWLEFSPDGRLLASTDAREPGVRLWDVRTGRELGRLAGHRDRTLQTAFAPDGRTLATVGGDGALKLWHLPTRREVATLLESGAGGPVGFSPDGTFLLAARLSDQIAVFRAPALAELESADAASP